MHIYGNLLFVHVELSAAEQLLLLRVKNNKMLREANARLRVMCIVKTCERVNEYVCSLPNKNDSIKFIRIFQI